ncbi:FOG: Ankyrin repeat [Plasmopara halstedii]|uniref:FOG: Ankyrin repeat n=1 Tax=Plasmopara halstedii TaxID=4781 RepID=A0A0P1ABY7_PLAHL|nr:FOG: Ankyrin repeat [Plasmopara halstedii]CEG37916.1 FOG: Ankyrin repeat [Plasmopara halstedii]|eukprot:XP_024574285.1 FOG: Ankyrin repeat [Plasmopara halstedii]
MVGGDDLSVTMLSLEDEDTHIDDKENSVRESVISGGAAHFMTAIGDIGDKSPLVYLMDWLHAWQQEYEAFVHILGVQEDSTNEQEAIEAAKDLKEMEAEAEPLIEGFSKVATALLKRLNITHPDSLVDRHGWTLLMQSANSGLYKLTKELIALKADVNNGGTSKDAANPLYLALASDHIDVALLLLQNGAIKSATKLVTVPSLDTEHSNDVEDHDCALFQACRFGHLDVIKEMLALGADLTSALPLTGDRALHIAVMFEMQDVVKLLVESDNIDLNALNKSGQTCIFGCSSVDIVKLLVATGVDPNITDNDDETALSIAQALGDEDVARYLRTVTQ